MIDFFAATLEFVVTAAIGLVVVNLLAWGILSFFMGAARGRQLMLRYYRWLGRFHLDVMKAVALSAGFFVCAMTTVWLFGVVKFH